MIKNLLFYNLKGKDNFLRFIVKLKMFSKLKISIKIFYSLSDIYEIFFVVFSNLKALINLLDLYLL